MRSDNKIELSKWRVRAACDRAGLTLGELADVLRTSVQTLSYRFSHGFSLPTAAQLAKVLNVQLEQIKENGNDFINVNEKANENGNAAASKKSIHQRQPA